MAKRSSRGAQKSSKSKSGQSQSSRSKSSSGIAGTYETATKAVSGAVSRVPASAFYWGLGSLALGAAAVGAYMYRDRLVEAYEEAMESFMGDSSSSDSQDSQSEAGRKSKGGSTQAQVDRH